jgi:hypothetical protein
MLVSKSLKGRRVKMIAFGGNAVKDFDGCIGEVVRTEAHGMNVQIEQGWSKGNNIYFSINRENFQYELYPDEWDI